MGVIREDRETEIHASDRNEYVVATLGFGFLDKKILAGNHRRYHATTPRLQDEVRRGLCPTPKGALQLKDPPIGCLDALTETLLDGAQVTASKGIVMLHTMRRLTGATYNYDEFLGDKNVNYRYQSLGCRLLSRDCGYRYIALPQAGPPAELLAADLSWDAFKLQYRRYLDHEILDHVVDAVIQSQNKDLLPVMLCCEPYVQCFESLSASEKAEYGCHRFLLCDAVVRELHAKGVSIRRLDLNPSEVRSRLAPSQFGY